MFCEDERHCSTEAQALIDCGGEHQTLDLFCKDTGIALRMSEPRNHASNGNVQRMQRFIVNMDRSMVFTSGRPLRFWGDTAEYVAYIFNISPSKANAGRLSTIQPLTKSTRYISDILVFWSPHTVHRNSRNKSLEKRAKVGMIVGKRNKIKGYWVYTLMHKIEFVTQLIKNLKTLTEGQIAQLRRVHSPELVESSEEVVTAPVKYSGNNQ
uniref:Putative retroelement pol polyprotein n=1 Tax=Albugo laibachii Nc14 TaxID=890382 RepID=F0WZI5_9STRA|nr:putative retroelement pol polyprotein [Albugo laibachii Nc14]|eukprot:CCA26909.1 putative retroelement pol polyprotein [Albugo laibachii Nc14]